MSRLTSACLLLPILLLASIGAAQTTPTRVRSVTTLPATCQAGDGIKPADMVALVASGFSTPYICGTTNNWFTAAQFSGIGTVPCYPANGITVKGDPNFTDDGSGHLTLVQATFVGSGPAGFAGFGQGTTPTLGSRFFWRSWISSCRWRKNLSCDRCNCQRRNSNRLLVHGDRIA